MARSHGGEHATRNADSEDQYAGTEHQFDGCGQFFQDDVEGGLLKEVGGAEVASERVADESAVLHPEGVIQSELVAQRFALSLRHGLPHQLAQRVAQVVLNREGNQADGAKNKDPVEQPANEELQHGRA